MLTLKILYAYEIGAGSILSAHCDQLHSSIIHQTEDALDMSGPGDWDFEIARVIRGADLDGLEKILRSIRASEIGAVTSPAKSKSSAENGKKGGRPKK